MNHSSWEERVFHPAHTVPLYNRPKYESSRASGLDEVTKGDPIRQIKLAARHGGNLLLYRNARSVVQ